MAAPGYVLKNRRTTLERAEKFVSDTYFTDCNLKGRLFSKTVPLKSILVYHAEGRIKYEEALKGSYEPYTIGQPLGPTWSSHWFRVEAEVPPEWRGNEVVLLWKSDAECLVWQNGEPLQGLTTENRRNHFTLMKEGLAQGSKHTLCIEMACNGLFGAGQGSQIAPPIPNKQFSISTAELAIIDRKVYQLLMDFDVILGMAQHLPVDSNRGYQALYTANQMVNTCYQGDSSSYDKGHEIAAKFLSVPNGGSQHTVCAVGHCHIDSAWLWPYDETIRKCARSWSSTVRLMETYENLTFACSQAQQFAWVKEHYPSLYEKIKHFVKLGRFVPVGSTWVEMDGNLPSGEAFCRQFLYGQQFFMQEFGTMCKEFWLPDTFGYSGQIPQIMKQSGITRFLTQKLSWNLVNKFPHHTFHWAGIDGSQVLAHFPPGDDYNMNGDPKELLYTLKNFQDKGRSNRSLYLYGWGDGGQGPTEDMVERLERMKDVDGLPKVSMTTPDAFFSQIEESEQENLCVWHGELFFELHNGTYTSQAKTKQNNRHCEFLLHDVEALSAIALLNSPSFEYPSSNLDTAWKYLLLNQFHDVLPGSSIGLVYEDADKHYKKIRELGTKMKTDALKHITNPDDDQATGGKVAIFNLMSWDRREVLQMPPVIEPPLKRLKNESALQTNEDGTTLALVSAPSYGFNITETVPLSAIKPVTLRKLGENKYEMKNEFLTAEIGSCGRVTSLIPASSTRSVVAPGTSANQFIIFDDVPLYWDAWDVMDYHLETRKPLEEQLGPIVVLEGGPLRTRIQVNLKISDKSSIKQIISLDVGCPYLKCYTEVNWHEAHKFLKVEFPVNGLITEATYDIQMGHVKRPSTFNNSWDWAKFEVCGHKWADASEHNFGLAVLNDSNYGWSCINNILRLSLLRSPKAPDENADMGNHCFTYGLMPHTGSFQDAGVIKAAYALNNHLIAQPIGPELNPDGSVFSLLSMDNEAVIVETIKKSEQKNGIVLRMYESFGGATTASILMKIPVKKAFRCNILEFLSEELPINNGKICLEMHAFEIASIYIEF